MIDPLESTPLFDKNSLETSVFKEPSLETIYVLAKKCFRLGELDSAWSYFKTVYEKTIEHLDLTLKQLNGHPMQVPVELRLKILSFQARIAWELMDSEKMDWVRSKVEMPHHINANVENLYRLGLVAFFTQNLPLLRQVHLLAANFNDPNDEQKKIKIKFAIISCYFLLLSLESDSTFIDQAEFAATLKQVEEVYQVNSESQHPVLLGQIKMALASVYLKQKKYQQALIKAQTTIHYVRKKMDLMAFLRCQYLISYCQFNLGQKNESTQGLNYFFKRPLVSLYQNTGAVDCQTLMNSPELSDLASIRLRKEVSLLGLMHLKVNQPFHDELKTRPVLNKLFQILLQHHGLLIGKSKIAELVWGYKDYISRNHDPAIYKSIERLRLLLKKYDIGLEIAALGDTYRLQECHEVIEGNA